MYTNEATLIGFIRPPENPEPYLIEFEGKAIASIQTVIETGGCAELHIPIFLTGETIEVAENWLKTRPRGFHARTQSTLVMHKGKPHAVVNYVQAREDRSWQIFE